MIKEELLFNMISAVSAEFHSPLATFDRERFTRMYERQADAVSGFAGFWDCMKSEKGNCLMRLN